MTIVSSVIDSDSAQKDGRRWIHEIHTDQIGVKWDRFYLCASNFNATVQLTADAVTVEASIESNEIAQNIANIEASGSLAVISTVYTTLSQTITAARAIFATATALQAVNLGDWFNSLSFVQLQSAFGFANVTAYNTFKASFFTPNATAAASVRTAPVA